MTDIILGVLHMCIFPGGLFALAVGLLFKGLDRRVEARQQAEQLGFRQTGPVAVGKRHTVFEIMYICKHRKRRFCDQNLFLKITSFRKAP